MSDNFYEWFNSLATPDLEVYDSVDIVASGYQWVCPECDELNKEIEYTLEVTCESCGVTFSTNPPEHALG